MSRIVKEPAQAGLGVVTAAYLRFDPTAGGGSLFFSTRYTVSERGSALLMCRWGRRSP